MTRYLESSIQNLGAAQGKQLELLQQEVLRQREEVSLIRHFSGHTCVDSILKRQIGKRKEA